MSLYFTTLVVVFLEESIVARQWDDGIRLTIDDNVSLVDGLQHFVEDGGNAPHLLCHLPVPDKVASNSFDVPTGGKAIRKHAL